jgi:NADH-quinone oxidoreductase subunit A
MSPYVGIVILLAIASGFVGLTIVTSLLVGPGRFNRAKYDSYECGIEPTPQPVGGGRFPVKYYITAMLFIVFDIEIVFLYPWAVAFDQMGIFALVEMILFIVGAVGWIGIENATEQECWLRWASRRSFPAVCC